MPNTHAIAAAPMSAADNEVVPASAHLSIMDAAAFVDGRLSRLQRLDAEAHLSQCAECRAEIADVANLLASAPIPRVRRSAVLWSAGALASAAAVVFLIARPSSEFLQRSAATRTERAPMDKTSPVTLEARVPAAMSTVGRDELRFVWRHDDGATYHVFVADAAGAPLFDLITRDTSVTPPRSVVLLPGVRYYWYVDALRANGTSLSSGPNAFSLRQ